MERMTHMRCNGIKSGYWSPEKKENLVQRLAEYENTGLEPEEIAEAVRKWIPVAEGLPLGDESVLVQVNGTYKNVTYENAILTGAYFEDGGWIIDEEPEWEDPEIVAWMPLPEPYRSVRKSLNLPKKRSKN